MKNVLQKSLIIMATAILAACGGEGDSANSQPKPNPVANRAPVISGVPPTTVMAGAQYTFTPTASDPDGNTLSFSVANLPAWATFDAATGALRGTPTAANVGTFNNLAISVSDGSMSASLPPFTVQVLAAAPTNRAPTISGTAPTTATVGVAYSFTPTASDPDGNTLAFSATGLPSWLSLNAGTGRVSGTPSAGNVGTAANIRITVSDGTLTASLASFSIQVAAAPANNSATISWVAPSQRVDGSALTNLSGFKVYAGQTSRNYTREITVAGSTSASSIVTGLGAGTWFFAVAAYDSTGVTSDPSTEVSKTF